MKSAILTTLVFITIACQTILSDQWVDQKYTYDSVLSVQCVSSTNFLRDTENHLMDIYLSKSD